MQAILNRDLRMLVSIIRNDGDSANMVVTGDVLTMMSPAAVLRPLGNAA